MGHINFSTNFLDCSAIKTNAKIGRFTATAGVVYTEHSSFGKSYILGREGKPTASLKLTAINTQAGLNSLLSIYKIFH